MGKHGPCCHCGVTSTPLWRNGPPEKPVLCNACGSRWRTKGSLVNYTPLHLRAETDGFSHYRVSEVKTISNKNKEPKVLKRKFVNDVAEYKVVPPSYNQELRKGFDEDTSNRSSSGSAISNCESSALCGSADASDLTGPPQPVAWDIMVPPRKKSIVTPQKPSALEKLTKDLYTIWYEQQSSCLSESSENDLLFETDGPMASVEFGHGSVLIREEESEASSLSFGHKGHSVNLGEMNSPGRIEDEGVNSSSREIEKIKKPANLELGP